MGRSGDRAKGEGDARPGCCAPGFEMDKADPELVTDALRNFGDSGISSLVTSPSSPRGTARLASTCKTTSGRFTPHFNGQNKENRGSAQAHPVLSHETYIIISHLAAVNTQVPFEKDSFNRDRMGKHDEAEPSRPLANRVLHYYSLHYISISLKERSKRGCETQITGAGKSGKTNSS